MNKSAIRKAAYQLIIKQKYSHQTAFDQLKEQNKGGLQQLADEIARFPSPARQKQYDGLRYTYVGLLALVMLLRVIGLISMLEVLNLAGPAFLFFVLIGILVPVLGIYGALTTRVHLYFACAVLLALSLFRGLTESNFDLTPLEWIMTLPQLAAAVLGFYLPTRLRTDYQKKVMVRHTPQGEVKALTYVFEDDGAPSYSDELLDQNL